MHTIRLMSPDSVYGSQLSAWHSLDIKYVVIIGCIPPKWNSIWYTHECMCEATGLGLWIKYSYTYFLCKDSSGSYPLPSYTYTHEQSCCSTQYRLRFSSTHVKCDTIAIGMGPRCGYKYRNGVGATHWLLHSVHTSIECARMSRWIVCCACG